VFEKRVSECIYVCVCVCKREKEKRESYATTKEFPQVAYKKQDEVIDRKTDLSHFDRYKGVFFCTALVKS
jgi:hypothetical protein